MRRISLSLAVAAALAGPLVSTAGAAPLAPALDSVYHLYSVGDHQAAFEMLQRLEPGYPRGNDNFLVRLEVGDCLLDKLDDYAAAESVYGGLLEDFPRDRRRPDVMYRLALAQELQEEYLDAAMNYEQVATQYMKSTYGTDALDAIERCFRKNYQERVAYVNGYPITRIELDDLISRNPSYYEPYEKKQALLDTMIQRRLMHEAALAAGITEDSSFARAYTEARNRAVFEEWYAREVTAKAEPSEKEVQARYRRDKATKYTTPEKVHGWQIVVDTRAQADSLRAALLSDTTLVWDSVAAEYSTAPDRERGGDMGLFARGVQQKAVEATAFRLKPGQISKPVQTDDGFVLLRITEKKPRVVKPYEDVSGQLKVQLRQEKTTELYEQKTEDMKRRASLVVDSTALDEGRAVLAVVNGIEIDLPKLEARINAIPPMFRAQFQTPEGMRRILDQLVLEQLILFECEKQKTWLWNKVVDRLLDQHERMLLDGYRRIEVGERVEIDSAALMAEYEATIDDFKVPEKVNAREIVAPTRARADQLRRWAVAGRLPELVEGRALLALPGTAGEARKLLEEHENTDSLVGAYGLGRPPALTTGGPIITVGPNRLPDIGRPAGLTGPYYTDFLGLGFKDLSKEDRLYEPTVVPVRTAEDITGILGVELPTDSAGEPVVDSSRLGSYVRLEDRLDKDFVRLLFTVEPGGVADPLEVDGGTVLVKVTRHDTAVDAGFDEIAKRFSTAGSRWNGGNMHGLTRNDKARDEKVIDTAFRLGKGRISQVIKLSDTSYTFITVEGREEAYTRPFDEVKTKLDTKLRREQEQALYDETVGRLTDSADIEIVMDESMFIFDTDEPQETGTGEELVPEPGPEPGSNQ